jgi:metal-responsive CopG/Arc/MetJ family transcriptional regulator
MKKRINFDIDATTANEFDEAITKGKFNKSAVLRDLVKNWIKKQEEE